MIRFLLLFFIAIFPMFASHAGGEQEELPIEEFYELIDKELTFSEQFVNKLLQEVYNKEIIPSDIRRIQYEMARASLNVKKILVANFIETPSILRKEVQDKLLEILRKKWIDQSDLLELSYLAKMKTNAEK